MVGLQTIGLLSMRKLKQRKAKVLLLARTVTAPRKLERSFTILEITNVIPHLIPDC